MGLFARGHALAMAGALFLLFVSLTFISPGDRGAIWRGCGILRALGAARPPLSQPARWRFLRYEPSVWELEWSKFVRTPEFEEAPLKSKPACSRFKASAEDHRRAEIALRFASIVMPASTPFDYGTWAAGRGGQPPLKGAGWRPPSIWTRNVSRDDVLSKLIYEVDENGKTIEIASFIEPLVVHLRHPYHCHEEKGLLDTSYIIMDRRTSALPTLEDDDPEVFGPPAPVTTVYLDLGATLFPATYPVPDEWGTSQGFFPPFYSALNLPFDSMSMWEITKHSPSAIYENVPGSLLGRYQYFNVPVGPTKDGGKFNSIEVLKGKLDAASRIISRTLRIAGLGSDSDWDGEASEPKKGASGSPLIYVVFKLDIDHPETENSLVAYLLDELLPGSNSSSLFDSNSAENPKTDLEIHEFFFEHHTRIYDVGGSGWCGRYCPPLSASYDMFTRFRERGVRAHSWI